MAEWSIAPVLKTDELRGSGGSNPSLSAENVAEQMVIKPSVFFLCVLVAYLAEELDAHEAYLFLGVLCA